MNSKIQGTLIERALENYKAYDMIQELRTMFEEQDKQELFEIVKAFHACKQEEGQLVSSYLLKMKSYFDILECLGYAMPNELGTIAKLHAMLKLYKRGIPKKAETPAVLDIQEGKIQKDKKKPRGAKGKDKRKKKLIILSPRSHHRLREIIQQRTLSATTARRWVIGGEIGLRESRKLKHKALSLYMGNGMPASIEAIRSFDLILPSGLIIVLDS
ncbi:hypothetical protein Tco_0304451, partial [Tanacetum coccineum]